MIQGCPLTADPLRCQHPEVASRVLVVDDQASFRAVAARIFVADGFTVVG